MAFQGVPQSAKGVLLSLNSAIRRKAPWRFNPLGRTMHIMVYHCMAHHCITAWHTTAWHTTDCMAHHCITVWHIMVYHCMAHRVVHHYTMLIFQSLPFKVAQTFLPPQYSEKHHSTIRYSGYVRTLYMYGEDPPFHSQGGSSCRL